MVTFKQLVEGFILYAEKELLTTLEGWRKWTGTAFLALVMRQSGRLQKTIIENKTITALGLVDETGNIDIDKAAEAINEAIRKHGKLEVDIPIIDMQFKFGEQNIDDLRGYIIRAGG